MVSGSVARTDSATMRAQRGFKNTNGRGAALCLVVAVGLLQLAASASVVTFEEKSG